MTSTWRAILCIAGAMALPVAAWQAARDLVYLELEDTVSRPQAPPNRWALVIGVSKYTNLPPQAQLRFAHRDAEDYARFLADPRGGGLPATHVRLFTEERATLANLRGALQEWLPASAGPRDVVYLFLAGHGVIGDGGEAYFVAHDSDPQNLHATGLSFAEVNAAIGRLRAGMVVLVSDACHSGSIGWSGSADTPSNALAALEKIGAQDRLVLKLLASGASERSYEDVRWGGGHGVFTYNLLEGLRGGAEREPDGVIRAAELSDYVSKAVSEQTGARQNPRVAGNFEPRLALAMVAKPRKTAAAPRTLDLRGPAGAAIYLENTFRGTIRPSGDLRLEQVPAAPVRLSVDLPGGVSFEQLLAPAAGPLLDLNELAGVSVVQLQTLVQRGAILGTGGAWEFYQKQKFPDRHRALASAIIAGGLENLGQACVNDYVQSTANGLKRAMLLTAVDGYEALKTLRPNDRSIDARQKFCLGRAQIAGNQFAEAEQNLRASIEIDNNFACAYNALGVALARLGRTAEARAAFDRAVKLTPEWSLPYFQIGQQLLGSDKAKQAVPYLEQAVRFNPKSLLARWTLMRAYRAVDRSSDVIRTARDLLAIDPNYAPAYLELGLHYDQQRDFARATLAYDTYSLLAPNFADSGQVRARASQTRSSAGRKPVSLFP